MERRFDPDFVHTHLLQAVGTQIVATVAPGSTYQLRVRVRGVAPAGALVFVAHTAQDLTAPAAALPERSFVVPVGESEEFTLSPGQDLHARGNVANVSVSVAAGIKWPI